MNDLLNVNIKNKTVLIRADFNVPMKNGEIINTFRLDSSLETINFCINHGAKIVLASHIGRPKAKESAFSLYKVYLYLKSRLNTKVFFSNDCISSEALNVSNNMNSGEVHVLENLRFHEEEKQCDLHFSKQLSRHADIFINDAFGTAHRNHASNVGVSKFFDNKYFGFLFAKELKYLSSNFFSQQKKIILILGGSKISDKIKIIDRFESIADKILIGGAMANNFLLAKGLKVGKSLIESKSTEIAKSILSKNKKIVLPCDLICSKSVFKPKEVTRKVYEINDFDIAADIGPQTLIEFNSIIKDASCVIWNGPMGIVEKKEFSKGTFKIIELLKKYTKNGLISILGGGDTSSLLEREEFNEFTHVSTGGGSCLSLLSGEVLPAIKSMEDV